MHAPQAIVSEFFLGGDFESGGRAALGIHPTEDVTNGAVLAAGVHSLQNNQQRMLAFGIKNILKTGQFFQLELQLWQGMFLVGEVTGLVGIVSRQLGVGVFLDEVFFVSRES